MATFPNWLLGRHTRVTIIPGSMDTNGNFVPTGSQSLVGTLDEVDVDSELTSENISPMDNPQANHVMIETDMVLNVTEILKANALNILAYSAWNYTHGYIVFQRGAQTWAGYFLFGNYNEGVRKNKSVGRLQLLQVIISGGGNPYYGVNF